MKRDGFGFLIDEVEEVEVDLFKKAKPKLKKVSKRKQILDLAPLEKTRMGSRFLREQMVMEAELPKDDPRVDSILDAYDHFLVEYEIDRSSAIPEPAKTEQVTLNGKPVSEIAGEKSAPGKRKADKAVQSPLSEFLEEEPKKKSKKTSKKQSPKKKGRGKKT